jgi:hypothetical protein
MCRDLCEGGVMDWKLKLDPLIESTMALANDVKRQSIQDRGLVVGTAEQSRADTSKQLSLPPLGQ